MPQQCDCADAYTDHLDDADRRRIHRETIYDPSAKARSQPRLRPEGL